MNAATPAQTNQRQQLRQQMRQKRRSLSSLQQWQAGRQLCRKLSQQPVFQRAKHIALYWPNDGEIDPSQLLEQARRHKKKCYLPVLSPEDKLWFNEYRRGEGLKRNGFGIPEPQQSRFRSAKALDIVLLPLVAFDKQGGRLGMGGGFYDRTFAWIKQHPKMRAPLLIGLAHSFQQVEQLPLESWDIPLHGIATEQGLIKLATFS
jgi:5-formyltetrahydrofolate cyclo-ligase